MDMRDCRQVMESLVGLAAGGRPDRTVEDICAVTVCRSGPSAFLMPRGFAMQVLRDLQRLGHVRVVRGRPQRYEAATPPGLPTLPDGYLYSNAAKGEICSPHWGRSGEVHVWLEDDRATVTGGAEKFVRDEVDAARADRIVLAAKEAGFGGGWLRKSFGISGKLTAPLERLDEFCRYLSKW